MNGVVMVINEFAPVAGGAEKQAERLAGHLAARGESVWVVTRRFPGLASNEEMNGFQVLRPAAWGPGKLKTISFVLGCLWHLWRLRKSYKILHAHLLFGPAFAATLAGRILGKRVIVKLGSSGIYGEIHKSRQTLRGRLTLTLLRLWVNGVVVLDSDMEAEVVSAGFPVEHIFRMSNGIDAMSFAGSKSRENAKQDMGLQNKTLVLFVGRLVIQKSIPTLLEAMMIAVQSCPNLHLILVGGGVERGSLEALVRDLGIQEFVTFAGNQVDVKPFLSAADIFVLPSEKEGMSNALLEAMAAGVACLASPVGASPQMLDRGRCGLLLPVGDVAAWADALENLTRDPIRREELGAAARQRVIDEYDFSVVGSKYEALYRNLIKRELDQAKAV